MRRPQSLWPRPGTSQAETSTRREDFEDLGHLNTGGDLRHLGDLSTDPGRDLNPGGDLGRRQSANSRALNTGAGGSAIPDPIRGEPERNPKPRAPFAWDMGP